MTFRGRYLLLLAWVSSAGPLVAADVVVASKQDAETSILAEMAAALIRSEGVTVRVVHSLGGTPVVWQALLRGDVDIYPEYTGTIAQQILKNPELNEFDRLRAVLAEKGIGITRPLGFANNYALGMKADRAAELGVRTISDLVRHPNLRFGFSAEFLGRADGWPGLQQRYGLPQKSVRAYDHQLAYRGLEAREIDATDLYTTDAEIRTRSLVALADDLGYFPRYDAVFAYRLDLAQRAPLALNAISRLEGRLTEDAMICYNEQSKSRTDPAAVAASAMSNLLKHAAPPPEETWWTRFQRHTIEHLNMVVWAVLASTLIGVPLGIVAARRPRFGALVLGVSGIAQTIPALALLALMIPLPLVGGTGLRPALTALILYGLLPIVRNTLTGLRDISPTLIETATALGLPPRAVLTRVELPLASRAILAGIKTSAIITVGTATLGALIGAGGYGEEILKGIQLNTPERILEGAVPAALMALSAELFFALLERWIVPRGLRLQPAT